MNFKTFLQKLHEAASSRTVGTLEANKKDRAKSDSPNLRAKDAARKRIERSKQTPRSKKSKQELIKDVIIVKTEKGRVQLIFKDSFNKNYHQKISKDSLSIEEAQQITKDPKFEQTQASKLLFGNIREKEVSKREPGKKEEPKKEKKPEAKKVDIIKAASKPRVKYFFIDIFKLLINKIINKFRLPSYYIRRENKRKIYLCITYY
jgi:hypothetical protein